MNVGVFYKCHKCGRTTNTGIMVGDYAFCSDCLNKNENQKAIECLEDVRSFISDNTYIKEPDYTNVCNYIDQKISQLKGEWYGKETK